MDCQSHSVYKLSLAALLIWSGTASAARLTVVIDGVTTISAPFYLQLQPLPASDWQPPDGQELPLTAAAPTTELQMDELAAGRYGLRLYQDLNGNHQLDRDISGYPLEPVGFSGNPELLLGEPLPADCELVVGDEGLTTHILLVNPNSPTEGQRP